MSASLPSIQEIQAQDFYIGRGLYQHYSFTEDDVGAVIDIVYTDEPVECYCVECGKSSVFTPTNNKPNNQLYAPPQDVIIYTLEARQVITKEFNCSRVKDHGLSFSIRLEKGVLSKIGQYPSFADVHSQDVKKYRKLLGDEMFKEYNAAVGLFAHGVGVGALVYLRRIIEKFMLQPAYEAARSSESGWDDEFYNKLKVKERIKLLNAYLPAYLVDNPVIYGIVSKGIHELSDEECRQLFPVVRSFIEVVLTDLQAEQEQKAQRARLASEMQKIASRF